MTKEDKGEHLIKRRRKRGSEKKEIPPHLRYPQSSGIRIRALLTR